MTNPLGDAPTQTRRPRRSGSPDWYESGRDAFAGVWAKAISGTSYVSLSTAEIKERLVGITDQLVDALFGEPFAAEPCRQVGIALVDLHFTGPETLGRTVAVLGDELLPRLCSADSGPRTDSGLRTRISALQGAVAAGYAQRLRERTLDEQEAIREAVMAARDEAELALRESEARFRALFADAAVGIAITDMDGTFLEANGSLQDMTGYSLDELRQHRLTDFMPAEDATTMIPLQKQLASGQRDFYRAEKRLARPNGDTVWTHVTVSLIRDDRGDPQYQIAVAEDVTDRHRLQTRLHHQALHDPLTGLANRALFLERLDMAFERGPRGARVGLCYLDLDGFKVINDSLGHDIGDQLLIAVADRLARCAGGPGRTVARMGGDEFVILVEKSASTEQVLGIADKILEALVEPVQVGTYALAVSASIGVVERQVGGTLPADLMRDADITLYWAKADGKDKWALFDADRTAREVARFTLSATMPAAVDREEFFVDYQPLVRLSDRQVVGVEALVRWRHPDLGLLPPDKFIGLAEETGQIVPLGRWVLARACAQAKRWQDSFGDRAPFISVNLAVRQSEDPGLVDDVARILSETGLAPEKLQLELTESAVMSTADEPLDALRALADMGIRIAIDDFGTGYSNLAYLRHLPVHELKIAGSFVDGLRRQSGSDPVDANIVATLVSLAHTLGLTVTAEGVETAAQASQLRAIGCDAGQGWYFARPGRPEAIDGALNSAIR